MSVRNVNGHGVTGVLPSTSDATSVAPVTVKFPGPPANQSGGSSTGKAKVDPDGSGKKY